MISKRKILIENPCKMVDFPQHRDLEYKFLNKRWSAFKSAIKKLNKFGIDAPDHLTEEERVAVCFYGNAKMEISTSERDGKFFMDVTFKDVGICVLNGRYEVCQLEKRGKYD